MDDKLEIITPLGTKRKRAKNVRQIADSLCQCNQFVVYPPELTDSFYLCKAQEITDFH